MDSDSHIFWDWPSTSLYIWNSHQWREWIDEEERLRDLPWSGMHECVWLQVKGCREIDVELPVSADGQGGGSHKDVLVSVGSIPQRKNWLLKGIDSLQEFISQRNSYPRGVKKGDSAASWQHIMFWSDNLYFARLFCQIRKATYTSRYRPP